MSDVSCPNCQKRQEINHDDGCGYDEDVEHKQDCVYCGKPFKFFTEISYSYQVFCAGEHDLELSLFSSTLWNCKRCDYFETRG